MALRSRPGSPGVTFQRLALNGDLVLYLLEDGAVLFSARSRRLFGLDRATTVTLLRLVDGETVESLAAGLGEAGAATAQELAALLAGEEPLAEEYRAEAFCRDGVPPGSPGSPRYRLLATGFTLDCVDETVHARLSLGLRHLLDPDQPDVDLAVTVDPEGPLWRLCLNGTPQGGAVPVDMLVPMLYDRLRKIAYQRLTYLLAMHAAVVTDGCHTLVLPGQSGSGKSTLAASLLGRGYQLCSDEVAVLAANGDLVPIPLGLGLKSGSWPLLERDYPALAATDEHTRWDGSRVRYLEPETIPFAHGRDSRQATHLCFPRFQPNGAGGLESLGPVQALRTLTESGYQVRGLDEECVERIVTWLLGLSCFVLTYSSAEEALHLLLPALESLRPQMADTGGTHGT